MKIKFVSLLGITAMIAILFVGVLPVSAAPPTPDYKPVDVGPEQRTWEPTQDRITGAPATAAFDKEEALAAAAGTPYEECVLDAKDWLSLDDFNGQYFFTTFYLVAETAGSELWVQTDLSWPDGDPRDTPVVTCEQAAYLLGEFDNNMYPTETGFFGTPDMHDGSLSLLEAWGFVPPGYYDNAAGRQVVLVSNIRDSSYYDYTFPNYIAGFYSSTFEAYFDRNIMSIDAYDWMNRVGPDGGRPYLYESVFAHEYQHLLHDDYDSDEVNWINEGLSMFSEFLTGYVVNEDSYSTFQELPENSLTAWGDQGDREIVADYGLVFLYHMYLYEKFGQDFIKYEFMNLENDISSIVSTLAHFGIPQTFAEIYHDFSIAVLIDSEMDSYRYGFDLLDVGIDIGHPGKPNPDAFASPGAPPWGGDYVLLWGYERIANLKFNGFEFNPTPWVSVDGVLYGGKGDLLDNFAIFEVSVPGTDPMLNFDTYYDIEDNWDFGFVQVSTDGGETWTSLANEYTTDVIDPAGHPNIAAQLPGLTSWSCFADVDEDCWINMSFDLGAYAGQNVLLAFRFMTDWAFTYEGWKIDNVYVNDTLLTDGSSTDGILSMNELLGITNDYTVQLVGEKNRKGESEYEVLTILSGGYATDWESIRELFDNNRYLVMVVTYDAPEGITAYADYNFEIDHRGGNHIKK